MRLRWLAAGAVVVAGAAAFLMFRPEDGADSNDPDAALAERLPLAEPGVEGSVVRLLRATEGEADPARLDPLVTRYRDGEPLAALAQELVGGPRFVERYGRLDDRAFVERIYDDLLGRAPSDHDRRSWAEHLRAGAPRSMVVTALTESAEYVDRTDTPPPLPPRRPLAPAGIEHSIVRMYLGLRGEWPDRVTLDAAVARYLDGVPLALLAEEVVTSDQRLGQMTPAEFVRSLYRDVLDRPVDPVGESQWRARLDAGEPRGAIAVGFTESPEMQLLTRTAAPMPAPIRHTLLAVGDSVMLGAVEPIQGIPNWRVTVDARGCRQPTWRGDGCGAEDIPSGIDALRAARAAGQLGGAVVLHLGNNGPMSAEEFDALMAEVADQRLVLALTLHEPRSYEGPNNAVITGATARWPNLRIIDWHSAAKDHPEWFGDGEGIHLSRTGAAAMAELIAAHLPEY
ncbi:MAG TPA: DUF4214 domain-containing protein [Acidimicrobiales bacterium]